jgi:glycosyltransferase involved in cell wall biosynthesis
LISHIPETSQNQRNLISLFYHFVEGRYDLVHAWQDLTNVIVSMAALMAGVPRILMSARSLSPDTKTMLHMRKAGFIKGAYLHLLSSENVVLCHNSEAGAQSYRNWLNSNEHWFPVLHNGTSFGELIDHLDDEEVLKLNEYIQWKNGRIAIGSVFRFVPEKRPLLWVDVANNLLKSRSDVCFVMVGNGALYEEVIEKVNQLGISEYFFFPGLSNSVGNWLENMDLFLLTSRIEGLPNVIIEAQGFGVPVVSTDAGGAEEVIIPDVSGLIAKQEHISEISGLLLKSIEDEEWRINAKQVSRIHAREKFSIDGMYTRLLELYGKMG